MNKIEQFAPHTAFLICIVITCLTCLCVCGEDKPIPQPPEVIKAMADFDKSVYSAYKIYEGSTGKVAMDTIAVLEKAKLAYMQKGDLEGANLVVAAIKKLNDGDALAATEAKIKESMALFLRSTTKTPWVGKWKRGDAVFTVNADGTIVANHNDNIVINGTWKLAKAKDILLDIVWDQKGPLTPNMRAVNEWRAPVWRYDPVADKLGVSNRIKE